ncbi:MAG TPA: DNA-binding protein WhiA [Candidatus Eremiobacteraceae bacterium]|nr:DNA-binding protein WhiA [Candidatus Eremiobacteraceae bacterium]
MFSADAKDEIARAKFERTCCPAAFVRSLACFAEPSPVRGQPVRGQPVRGQSVRAQPVRGQASLAHPIVRTARPAIARSALKAAKLAGIAAHSSRATGTRFHDGQIITVCVDSPLAAHLDPPGRSCCRRAWLRGAFLACGSVPDPARGYHLEFFCHDDAAARALIRGLADFSIDAGISRRRHRALVYVKGVQAVADVLAQMGAANAVLILDDVRARRETKNVIRRAVNAETANAARAGAASARQREAAVALLGKAGLRLLSPAIREAARLRVAHPDLTLAELAKRSRPAVTKATMGYRLRALERLAGEL